MKISKTCFLDEINLVLPQPLFQGHWAAGQGTEPSADTSDTGHNTRLDWGPHLCTTLHSLVSHEPPLSTEGSLPFLGFGLWRLPSTGIWRRQASPNSDHLLSWHRCSPHLLSASGLTFPYQRAQCHRRWPVLFTLDNQLEEFEGAQTQSRQAERLTWWAQPGMDLCTQNQPANTIWGPSQSLGLFLVYRHISYYVSQTLSFLQTVQVYWRHFPNSIYSLCVSAMFWWFSQYFKLSHYYNNGIIYYILYIVLIYDQWLQLGGKLRS